MTKKEFISLVKNYCSNSAFERERKQVSFQEPIKIRGATEVGYFEIEPTTEKIKASIKHFVTSETIQEFELTVSEYENLKKGFK